MQQVKRPLQIVYLLKRNVCYCFDACLLACFIFIFIVIPNVSAVLFQSVYS